jgi:hypothetical protein
MKLFKHQDRSDLFQIHQLTEDELVAAYNVCLNYKSYIEEIIKKPDDILLKIAPGSDASQVRNNLKLQLKFCDDYIMLFQETTDQGKKKE